MNDQRVSQRAMLLSTIVLVLVVLVWSVLYVFEEKRLQDEIVPASQAKLLNFVEQEMSGFDPTSSKKIRAMKYDLGQLLADCNHNCVDQAVFVNVESVFVWLPQNDSDGRYVEIDQNCLLNEKCLTSHTKADADLTTSEQLPSKPKTRLSCKKEEVAGYVARFCLHENTIDGEVILHGFSVYLKPNKFFWFAVGKENRVGTISYDYAQRKFVKVELHQNILDQSSIKAYSR